MKRQLLALSREYEAALQRHLQPGPARGAQPAQRLGQQAVTLGLETLDLARIHKTALTALMPPICSAATRGRIVRRAGSFFTEAITPIEQTHRAGVESAADLNRKNKTLTRRTAQLAVANRHLKQGILQRKTAEQALRKSGKHHAKSLRESQHLQTHLRHLIHQLLSAQESERRKISHDLRDEIAQTLLGINVRLLMLKKCAEAGDKGLSKEIASTQGLVKQSVKAINRIADKVGTQREA
jgi:signal transduction histidine kinase